MEGAEASLIETVLKDEANLDVLAREILKAHVEVKVQSSGYSHPESGAEPTIDVTSLFCNPQKDPLLGSKK